jgi:putative membrane protein insertion efficiency factor
MTALSDLAALLQRIPQRVLIGLVQAYRLLLSPWLGNACRFEPTCSRYALQALERHGAWRGTALAGWRVLRCHPWCEGGCDPVPDTSSSSAAGAPARPDDPGARARPPAARAD